MKYITEKIEITVSKESELFLIKNSLYRDFLYNECVSYVKDKQQNDDYGRIGNFKKNDLLLEIRDRYERKTSKRPDFIEKYDYYFRGISAVVVMDIYRTIKRIISDRKKGLSSDINYHKNSNKFSFSFENKVDRNAGFDKFGNHTGNRIVLTNNPFIIGVKINKTYNYPLGIELREPIFKLMRKHNWKLDDIHYIRFVYSNDKWFINLVIDKTNDIRIIKNRMRVCGIDLGETNPVVMYDGMKVNIPNHLKYPKDAISKVNRHIENCKRVMDRKYSKDRADSGLEQSKNYYKVLRKFHKYHERRKNILKDWHFKLAHWIVTHYKNIVVDEFKGHIVRINSGYLTRLRKSCNYSMLNKSMYNFKERLIHMCYKYGTNYFRVIKESGIETTNTCSLCGNINEIKLNINQRVFKCEKCGFVMDRDDNASINCYNLYKNKNFRNVYLELVE